MEKKNVQKNEEIKILQNKRNIKIKENEIEKKEKHKSKKEKKNQKIINAQCERWLPFFS